MSDKIVFLIWLSILLPFAFGLGYAQAMDDYGVGEVEDE